MREIATLVNSLAMTGLVLHVIARALAPAAISYGLLVKNGQNYCVSYSHYITKKLQKRHSLTHGKPSFFYCAFIFRMLAQTSI